MRLIGDEQLNMDIYLFIYVGITSICCLLDSKHAQAGVLDINCRKHPTQSERMTCDAMLVRLLLFLSLTRHPERYMKSMLFKVEQWRKKA
jgi:hypothetical protein